MRAARAEPPANGANSRLFDRHREPRNQPRNLIQMLGIMLLNGLRKPEKAFVVTHSRNIAGTIEGTRPDQVGRMAGIESAPINPARPSLWPIGSNWRPGP